MADTFPKVSFLRKPRERNLRRTRSTLSPIWLLCNSMFPIICSNPSKKNSLNLKLAQQECSL